MDDPRTISRRSMLKRFGAGAAIAWTAPVLTSLRTPAFAASPVCTSCDRCSKVIFCVPDECRCGPRPDGSCFCRAYPLLQRCESFQACSRDADCPPGFGCVQSCCPTLRCLPRCGAQVQGDTADPGDLTPEGVA